MFQDYAGTDGAHLVPVHVDQQHSHNCNDDTNCQCHPHAAERHGQKI